ncbi:MaoC family dehydratase [Caulobacter hibisci]|uniref:MaoC family dehydratase n=1 Tax=Caulobacter hibisci TaxID=2035993 RepID=A0ABS0T352_9CAUL|nr:MaoC family dehydratase [Caulobacter hibisci]MBI1686320.1 MaoC family dehydratase [Caulobacter hibisci]
MADRYLDDLTVGETWTGQPFTLTEAEILDFARLYDPQPMHVDLELAAGGRFGGIIASGWHVASRVMREYVDTAPFGATPMLGVRIDELCWLKPVRPGDALTVRREIVEATRSRSRSDRGTIRTFTAVCNQHGETVLTFFNLIQMPAHAGVTL